MIHSSVSLASESDVSTCKGAAASSIYWPHSVTPCTPLWYLDVPKYHKTEVTCEHVPTVLAPALHVQYHAMTWSESNCIHKWYDLEDT